MGGAIGVKSRVSVGQVFMYRMFMGIGTSSTTLS